MREPRREEKIKRDVFFAQNSNRYFSSTSAGGHSTRLKAGTATKLVLNLLSTHAMVRLGKVRGNLMIDLNPSNVKLRDRAVRIVRELTGLDETKARERLIAANWVVRGALTC